MSITGKVEGVKRLLSRMVEYERLIDADNFEPPTVEDMKGNAKDLCNTAKAELDDIKSEIDNWS